MLKRQRTTFVRADTVLPRIKVLNVIKSIVGIIAKAKSG